MDGNDAHLFLFGATGDLDGQKILPALQQGQPARPSFPASGVLAADHSTRQPISPIEKKGRITIEEPLLSAIRYQQLDFNDPAAFVDLAHRLGREYPPGTRRLFFLAVNPEAFVPIASGLRAMEGFFSHRSSPSTSLRKPFGEDFASAARIQEELMTLALPRSRSIASTTTWARI